MPSFHDGEGISVITTQDSVVNMINRGYFATNEMTPGITPAYRLAEVPGKGMGLLATRRIRQGQRVMQQTPAVVVNDEAVTSLGRDALAELLSQAMEALPAHHRGEVLGLSTHSAARDHGDRVYKIFAKNSYTSGMHDGVSTFRSLYSIVSRINHSCRPNLAYYFDSSTFTHNVIAVRTIEAGEELTVSYIDPFLTHAQRQALLHSTWGFHCACDRCSASASQTAASDARVSRIHDLWARLDDYARPATDATPRMAESLVALYEREGIVGRVQEAHYRAAVEWIGVGDAGKAAKHAELCVHYGVMFKGPGRPFVEKMRELLREPEGYTMWGFRLRNQEL
ncbi:SET domain-containing protein [Xylariaceae sp. FL0016]|nr:SET domain-containing protein [Xylariaceae sp. FL0016]